MYLVKKCILRDRQKKERKKEEGKKIRLEDGELK